MIWGSIPQMAAFKAGMLDVWSQGFAPQREVGIGCSVTIVWHSLCWARVYSAHLSLPFPFPSDIFSVTQHVGVTQLASKFLSNNCSMGSCVFDAPVEEGYSGTSCVTIFVMPSCNHIFLNRNFHLKIFLILPTHMSQTEMRHLPLLLVLLRVCVLLDITL